MTVREALALSKGRPDRRTAAALLGHAAGMREAEFLLAMDVELPEPALARYQEYLERAKAGEPAQYVLGEWDFYGRAFKTDRRALIPRPETERLVEEALRAIPNGVPCAVADVGCGTGCIGITFQVERPAAAVTLLDVSADALSLARENALLLDAGVSFVRADMCEPLPGRPYDCILSNPPYVDAADMGSLPPAVRMYEPETALYGGEDGLDCVRALADRGVDSLKAGGRMFIEIGYNQAERSLAILRNHGLEADAIPDYAGIPRVLAARKEP